MEPLDISLVPPELVKLSENFLWNADNALADSSPFYEKLARRIAGDPDMLRLAAHAQDHQPPMNMIFAAVHYLLLRGSDDPLTHFFADIARKPNLEDDPYPIFRAFCLEHRNEIIPLLETRRVQTNEVARCAFFLPAFRLIANELEGQPLALIEVGSSAGLNLNWDKYGYAYGNGSVYGDAFSPVFLTCELRGEVHPPLSHELAQVASRVGIDLNPNDVFDDDAMLWLLALVWPEQLHRAQRLKDAIAIARQYPPRLIQGDALEVVPSLVGEVPSDVPVVLFHSFVLNQFRREMREAYYAQVKELSAGRVIYDLGVEPGEWPTPMTLTRCRDGDEKQEVLAACDHHGRWLAWKE